MKTLKPVSFGHRGCIGKKAEAKEANRVSAKCAIAAPGPGSTRPRSDLGKKLKDGGWREKK
jgi:hypothetical protein